MSHIIDNSMCRLSNYFLARRIRKCLLLYWRESGGRFAETNFSRPLPLPKRATTLRNSLARVPGAKATRWRIPSSIPILLPPDGLSFLPRRRSTLKVIFRRPENVKPSVVSKRSPGAGAEFRSFLVTAAVLLLLFFLLPLVPTRTWSPFDSVQTRFTGWRRIAHSFFLQIPGFNWSRLQTLKEIHAPAIIRFESLSIDCRNLGCLLRN